MWLERLLTLWSFTSEGKRPPCRLISLDKRIIQISLCGHLNHMLNSLIIFIQAFRSVSVVVHSDGSHRETLIRCLINVCYSWLEFGKCYVHAFSNNVPYPQSMSTPGPTKLPSCTAAWCWWVTGCIWFPLWTICAQQRAAVSDPHGAAHIKSLPDSTE